MSKAPNENLGFLSRMSELELKLKQSEDERLVLEDKFNKLLNARKSEEEMHLYLLRENYSQLLRQDKMRCDRNDMIMQALANVESRTSMLTAKTDRLRLLRQHYESYVSHHYPSLKKNVSRHRSVESLVADTNENLSQRSLSSSPRLMSSYSPSPFVRSPSITRRNSLVVSNLEIMDQAKYKVPSKINFSSHLSRKKLFDNYSKLDKNLDRDTLSTSFFSLRYDTNYNISTKNTSASSAVNSSTVPFVQTPNDNERTNSGMFLQIPSVNDYTENGQVKISGKSIKEETEQTFAKISQPLRNHSFGRYEKLSPTRTSLSVFSPKPSPSKPLTKSSSFSFGYSRNVSNYNPSEIRQSSSIRRPTLVHQTTEYPETFNRFQSSVNSGFNQPPPFEQVKYPQYETCSFSNRTSFNGRSNSPNSVRGRSPTSERAKSPFSERAKSPLSERSKSPFSERNKSSFGERWKLSSRINSKSPLTVVDDIFKKYLINYDKRYLSDPISESKYGKYLYPLSHYDCIHSQDERRNQVPDFLDAKYYRRPSFYDDDISISSRESVGINAYKSYGSRDTLLTNDPSVLHEKNISYFNDKRDWKEWDHYRNRYEYPPAGGIETHQLKPSYMDDFYYPVTNENVSRDIKSSSYKFPDDLSVKYSHSSNLHNKSDEYIPYQRETPSISKDYKLPYNRKVLDDQDLTSKDAFKMPQTPKKVSFSNEFLYDDKSDTELSSNVEEVTIPTDYMQGSKTITQPIEDSFQISGENIERKIQDYIKTDDKTLEFDGEAPESKYIVKENSSISNIKDFNDPEESVKDRNHNESYKDLDVPCIKEETNTSTVLQDELNQLIDTKNKLKETKDTDNYSLVFKGGDLGTNEEKENLEGLEKEGRPTGENDDKSDKGSTELINNSLIDTKSPNVASPHDLNLVSENEVLSVGNNDIQSNEINTKLDKGNIPSGQYGTSDSFIEQDSASQNYESNERVGGQTPTDTNQADEVVYSEESKIVYDQVPHEQSGTYDDHTAQQYNDPNVYTNSEISQYPNDYNREQYDQPQQQYDQYNEPQSQYVSQLDGGPYVGEEYVQNDAPIYDQTQDAYVHEQYASKDYQQAEVYPDNQYEQQPHVEYDGGSFRGSQQNIQDFRGSQQNIQDFRGSQQNIQDFRGSQQNIQDFRGSQQNIPGFRGSQQSIQDFRGSQQNVQEYQQPLPQKQYEDGSYITQDQYEHQYKEDDQSQYPAEHYMPETVPQDYVSEQPYEGEYPQDYPQQQYDPNYQDPSQVPQDAEQYKADYDPAYQDNSQYGYDQAASRYDDQYQQPGPEYEQQQQPPFDQYEQQPPEHYDDQYQGPTDQYQGPTDQYQGPADQYQAPIDQYQGPTDQYQGSADQYGTYDYTYDQTAPATDQTYLGDEHQTYVEGNQPYEYNEPVHQPYEEVQQMYPGEQQAYVEDQPAYEAPGYVPQNVEKLPSEYESTLQDHSNQLGDGQLAMQQNEPLYEPEAVPYTEPDLSSSEPAPSLNKILESDPESSVAHGVATHEDSSDFDFSTSQK